MNPKVRWTPARIEHTLGRGLSADDRVTVSLVATEPIAGVLWIPPELQPFVRTETKGLILERGVPQTVSLRFTVPPRAAPGNYDGVIQFRAAGSKNAPVIPAPLKIRVTLDYGDIVVNPSTQVIPENALQSLVPVSPDSPELVFQRPSPEVLALKPGALLVATATPTTPFGLLRKVVSVSTANGKVVLQTAPAQLADAFENLSLSYSGEVLLEPPAESAPRAALRGPTVLPEFKLPYKKVLYDYDKDLETKNDQLTFSADLTLSLSFDLDLSVHQRQLRAFRFKVGAKETFKAQLGIALKMKIPGLDQEATVWSDELDFKRVLSGDQERIQAWMRRVKILYVGWIPVVLAPYVTIKAGSKGELAAALALVATQTASLGAGVEYLNGRWSPIGEHNFDIKFDAPTLSGEANVRGFLTEELGVKFYETAGCYLQLQEYIEGVGKVEAKLPPIQVPQLSLSFYAGAEAKAGVRCSVLGFDFPNQEFPATLSVRKLLWAAKTKMTGMSGKVLGADTGHGLPGTQIEVYNGATRVDVTRTDEAGAFSFTLPAKKYKLLISREGFFPATYANIEVQDDHVTNVEPIYLVSKNVVGAASPSGRIVNALTGSGQAGVNLDLREGINMQEGPVVASTVTAANGEYRFNDLQPGNYTAEASGQGFNSFHFNLYSADGAAVTEFNAAISPVLPEGETRIVLTWGASPSDLDSHFLGPLPDGSRFHLYYPHSESGGSGSPWREYVLLDVDDTTQYGPETVTIVKQSPGVYRYLVHDYSNRGSSHSTALSNSGATVRVFRGSGLVAIFPVPSSQEGTVWTVFEMSGETITPINQLSYAIAPESVRGLAAARREEGPPATPA